MKILTSIILFSWFMISCSVGGSGKQNNTNNINNINNANNTNNQNVPEWVGYETTECKNGLKTIDTDLFHGFECLVYLYDGSNHLELRHVNVIFNCCPDEVLGVTGEVAISGNTFTLTESDNGQNCRCECPYDLTYQLQHVSPGTYEVVVAPFDVPIVMDLSAATEAWFCIDRLSDPNVCMGSGERGCFCSEHEQCMGGDGYCLEYDSFDFVCVNTCETDLDCPMPDLESCVEDEDQIRYCSPLSLTI